MTVTQAALLDEASTLQTLQLRAGRCISYSVCGSQAEDAHTVLFLHPVQGNRQVHTAHQCVWAGHLLFQRHCTNRGSGSVALITLISVLSQPVLKPCVHTVYCCVVLGLSDSMRLHHRFMALVLHAAATQLNLRVIAPDRPGVGDSTPVPGRTVQQYPADIAELCGALGESIQGAWECLQWELTGYTHGHM